MQTNQHSTPSRPTAGFGDSGDRTARFGVSSHRKTGANSQKVSNVMSKDQTSSWKQSSQGIEFKFLNLVHFRAKSVPSWLVVVFFVFVLLAIWILVAYPIPAIITGIGGVATHIKKIMKPG